MRVPVLLLMFAVTSSLNSQASAARNDRVLARDVDKRPLPKVTMAELSPSMRKAVQALINSAKANATPQDKNRATPPSLTTTIYRIPVAPRDHKLYFIDQNGELACSPNQVNCVQTVLDETPSGIVPVVSDTGDSAGAGISVVRRPNLQMPDIAASYQLGHFAMDVTVFRFDGKGWHPYLCKEIEPINADPDPAIIANKPCKK